MKKILSILTLCGTMALSSCETLQQVAGSMGGPVTEAEAGQGIKEALAQGLVKSVLQLNNVDGFFKDAVYKILMPPEAKKIENTLRSLGMNSLVDKAILSINRGAEEAVGTAKPIFADAIKSMTLQDAIGLIKNGDTSATHFFRVKTTDKLVAAFTPIIQASLNKTDATKYYGDVIKTYNDLPVTFKKLNPDLTGYVTNKATNALFDLIGKEEVNIRNNFVARTTKKKKKVFGAKW